jgi:dihydroorotase
VTDSDGVEQKARHVTGRAAVDVLLYALPVRPRALARLAETAGGFKVYLSPTTGVEEVPASVEVPGLLARLAELRLPVSVHAEDPSRFRTDLPDRGLADWNARRPAAAELAAVASLVDAPSSLRLHVAHVTTGTVADRLRAAGVSFEATPHHLLLSERSGDSSYRKVNPPLRSEADRAALWARFRRGEVPCLASDHAPHSFDAKDRPFDLAPSGMPGVETMLPLMLARVRASELELGTLVAAASDRPSRWVGQPRGRLAVGHRADLLVVDFRARTRLEARRLHAPCGWTAFEGWEAIFPREHYRRGERIVEDGQYIGRPVGEVVRPEYARSHPPARTTTGARP